MPSIPTSTSEDANVGPALALASTSPRRRQLLSEAGFVFTAISPGVDDAQLGAPGAGTTPEQWVASLSYLKARAGADRLGSGFLVIGADTVVVKGDDVIGQPRDAGDARRIIQRLQNGQHRVITGVTLLDASGRTTFVDEAVVRVGDIGEGRLESYVASGGWRGKAGAYNLSERIADGWPISFDGDPGTVMGLPMRRLAPILSARLSIGAPPLPPIPA